MDSIPSTTPPIHPHSHHPHPLRGTAAYRHSEESISSNHSIRPMQQQGLPKSQSMLKQQQHSNHRQPSSTELSTRTAGRNASVGQTYTCTLQLSYLTTSLDIFRKTMHHYHHHHQSGRK